MNARSPTAATFEAMPHAEISDLRGEKLLRHLNRLVPLGRRYSPLIALLNGRNRLISLPFERYRVLQPSAWSKSITIKLLEGAELFPEFELLRPILPRLSGGVVIDVGANIGLFSLLLRSASQLPIIAYEPQPFLFKLLSWNMAYNRLREVELRNLACGSRPGEVAFSIGLNGSVVHGPPPVPSETQRGSEAADWTAQARLTQAGETVMNVPVVTLDESLAEVPSIALLKVDCEGFEYEIFQGALGILRDRRPLLLIEVHPLQLKRFGHSTRALLELISPGYDFEFWYFREARYASKLGESLARFGRPAAHRCANADEMLAAAERVPGPAQIYFLGHPRPQG